MSNQVLTIEEMVQYLRKNIKEILQRHEQEILLPQIADAEISSMSLSVTEYGDKKSVTLTVKVEIPNRHQNNGSLTTLNFLHGTDSEIIETLQRADYNEKLIESINSTKYWYLYDPAPGGKDYDPW